MTMARVKASTSRRNAPRPAGGDAGRDWQMLAWMGMRWRVPRDWEVLHHSTDPVRGRLILVDRRRQRMQLSWARLDSRPDIEQAIADHRSRDMTEDPEVEMTDLLRPHGWLGYTRFAEKGALSRFTRYEPALEYWIDLIVSHPARHDPNLDEALAAGFEARTPGPDRPQHWRAFGLDVQTPPEWKLSSTAVNAGDVTLRFAEKDGPSEVVVRRLGMIDAWFLGDVQQWLRHHIGVMVEAEFTTVRRGNESAVKATSREPGTRWRRILGKLRIRRDMAWVCDTAKSLICVTTWSPDAEPVGPHEFEIDAWPMI